MDSQGESMDSMVPVPVNTTEEIRRIVREELHRRNRPASINCFEKTQTVIRGAAMAVNRNINCQAVSSPAAGNGSTSSSLARSFRSRISSSVSSNCQQSTTSSINEVWGPWRASGNKRRGNPSHPGRYTY